MAGRTADRTTSFSLGLLLIRLGPVCLVIALMLGTSYARASGATGNGPSPLLSFTVAGIRNGLAFRSSTAGPGLLKLRVRAGDRRLTALYHFQAGENEHRVSLAGAADSMPRDGVLYFEAEFRFRRYSFERFTGGTGKGRGRFMSPAAIACGSLGRIYVVDQGNDRVQVFDRDYRYLFEFGGFAWNPSRSSAEEQSARFDGPSSITEASNKELFVTDRNNDRVVRFDLEGRYLGILGADEKLRLPEGIASDRFGHVVVCDSDNDRLLRFDTSGRLDYEYGSFGRGLRQFDDPSAAAYDPSGNLYVVDKGNARIVVLDRNFGPAFDIRLEGVRPVGVYVDKDYFLYVIDERLPRVLVLNNRFKAVAQVPSGRDGLSLTRPVALAIDRSGRMHIVDKARNAVAVVAIEQDMLVKRGKIRVSTTR